MPNPYIHASAHTLLGGDPLVGIDPSQISGSLTNIPPGTIFDFAISTPPAGWLSCDGSSYQISNYPNLYAVIGVSFGSSGGPGYFNVPLLLSIQFADRAQGPC